MFASVAVLALAAAVLLANALGGQDDRPARVVGATIGDQRLGAVASEAAPTAQMRRSAKKLKARQERLKSPRMIRERKASRTAYASLDSIHAQRATADKLPQLINDPAWTPPPLKTGEEIRAYMNESKAIVDMPGTTRDAIVESVGEPIATPDKSGGFSSVDVTLQQRDGVFVPKNTKVPVEIPSTSTSELRFGDPGPARIGLGLGGAQSKASLTGGSKKLFFANTFEDTDTIVEATPSGAEVSWAIRSPRGPSSLPLDFNGPASGFKKLEDGSISFDAAGLGRGTISAPTAHDAQGQPVAAELTLDDGRVSVKVNHAALDVAYPIAVDPALTFTGVAAFRDDMGLNSDGTPKPLSNNGAETPFPFTTSNATNFLYTNPAEGSGNRMRISIRNGAGSSGWANLLYDAPHGATIFRVHFAMTDHTNPYYTTLRAGLVNPGGVWESQKNGWFGGTCSDPNGCWAGGTYLGNNTGMPQSEVHSCASATCAMGGSVDNKALLQLAFDKPAGQPSNTSGSSISTRGAYIYYSDYSAPTLIKTLSDPTLLGTGWRNRASSSITLSADDGNGVGLGRSVYLDGSGRQMIAKSALNMFLDGKGQLPLAPAAGYEGTGDGPYCTGRFNGGCPLTASSTISSLGIGREGIRSFRFEASDIVGQTTSDTYTLKTDNSGPEIDISGRLGAFALDESAIGAGGVRTVVKQTPFVIQAFDGRQLNPDGTAAAGKDRRSGVQSISAKLYGAIGGTGAIDTSNVKVDFDQANGGGPKTTAAADCDQNHYPAALDSCKLNYSGTFDPSGMTPGIYYFKVTAIDWAGNQSDKVFKVGVGVASIESVTEGQTSARYVPLKIKRSGGQTATTSGLQFRTALSASWCDVPTTALHTEDDPVTTISNSFAFDGSGETSTVVVDLDALRMTSTTTACTFTSDRLADGIVYVRALLPGAGAEAARASEDVAITYSRGGLGTGDETQSVGPGSVDLVTGNFSMSATDVSADAYKSDLTLTRTFNSRYVNDPDHLSVFGPGWSVGLPSDGSSAFYTKVVDYASVELPEEERYAGVDIETIDGDVIAFELSVDPNKYIAEPGLESLELTRIPDAFDSTRTAGFKLYDKDSGSITTFKSRPDGAPSYEYQVTDSYTRGDSYSPTFAYGYSAEIGTYPTYEFAPSGGVACQDTGESADDAFATLPRGCQALRFNYNTGSSRLASVELKTYDPQATPSPSMTVTELARYTYDAGKRLIEAWNPQLPSDTKTTYTYVSKTDSKLLTIKNGGTNAFTLAYASLPEDSSSGRLSTVSRVDGSATATTSLRYAVPTKGGSAPFDFSASEVAKWAQEHPPFTATAIFNAAQPPNGTPATNYGVSSLSYLDPLGREINSRAPGGRIATTEYNAHGDVKRTLTADNRDRALALGTAADRTKYAKRWSTKNFYDDVPNSINGRVHLMRTIGPEHQVRLEGGSLVQARAQTTYCYDEATTPTEIGTRTFDGSCNSSKLPSDTESSEPFDLVTSSRTTALTGSDDDGIGGTTSDGRSTAAYYGSTQAELKLGLAQISAADPGSGKLNIKRKTDFNSDGLETARYQPRSQASGEPSTTKTYYYVDGTSPDDSACSNHVEWRGLPCKVVPGAQPTTSGLAKLPVKTITYNKYREPLDVAETVTDAAGATQTRTSSKTYDAAGRVVTEGVTGTVGTAVKTTQHVYNSYGQETETRSLNTNGTTAKTVSRGFDALGRQTGYTDAEGHTSSATYDILSRPVTTNDGKATRTHTYDSTTGDLSVLVDSGLAAAGPFAAAYDADGRILAEALPAGLTKSTAYDTDGNVTSLTYTRTVDCTPPACTWMTNTAEYNIHGQMVSQDGLPAQAGGTATQKYAYDAIGRLTEARDTSGGQCTIRRYELDADSNRTASKTIAPASGGACNPTGTPTTKTNTFDNADRITNSGYVYDAFGRTTTVPQADAGGTGAMTASYYVNDLARSVTQNGKTQTMELDPMLRPSTKTTSGSSSSTDTYSYAGDSDSPAWIQTGTNWTRWVPGIDGDVAATQTSAGALSWTISDIRGDMVAEAGGGGLMNVREIDEFGLVKNGLPSSRPYGFHGTKQKQTLTDGGTIAMGARLYVPATGRFLQTDPILGGTDNPYEYPSDPVNSSDLTGQATRFRLTLRFGPRQVHKLIDKLRREARKLREKASVQSIVSAVAGLGNGISGTIKFAGSKIAFWGTAAVTAGAIYGAYAASREADQKEQLADELESRLRECGGRGANIVISGILGDPDSVRVNTYRSGTKDRRGTSRYRTWQTG
ncbi:MAG: RHS repeat-associated core domain-containing protein [Solirubrobacterales bacterium]